MAAPAGVGSGSAPEPAPPEPAATEPVALEPVALEPVALEPVALEPVALEPVAAEVHGGERRGVSGLVVAGVILVLVAVATAAAVLVVGTHGFRHKTVVTYRPAPGVFSLRAGDCLNSSQNGLSVTILSCATPHEAEVFATFSLTGSSWPGEAAVQQQASSGCANRIAGYLNPQLLNAGLTQQYVYPDQDAWQAGVRTVVCEVSSASGPLSGSVRNSG
jgi:hypothetical protein